VEASRVRIVADVGGTNVRFASVAHDGRIVATEHWLTSVYGSFAEALAAYCGVTGLAGPDSLAVAAAGPLIRGRIAMTNCPWVLDRDELERAFPRARVQLMNDFAAQAMGLPALGHEDMIHWGGGALRPDAPKVVLGAGTGLGVAILAPTQGGWTVLSGEGGHVDLAPQGAREIAIVYQLQQMFGHVSLERVLSGPGLENLMLAIAAIDGVQYPSKPSADQIETMSDMGDAVAAEAMTLFAGWLGAAAGNLALTAGAAGGVYVAGGIVPRWGARFDARMFRHRFEGKGRMRDYLAAIPAVLVTAKDLAFRGLARALREA
jgi:glucokinase